MKSIKCYITCEYELSKIVPVDPPVIDPTLLEMLSSQSVTVKAGEAATIRIPFKGKPTPKVTWYKDGLELVEDSRTVVKRNGDSSTLILNKCVREDSGSVTLKLKNDCGSATATVQLSVIGESMACRLAQYKNALFH